MTQEGAKKHKDVIKAFCEGKQIQYYSDTLKIWIDINESEFHLRTEYRVKPEPKLVPFDYSDAEKLIGKAIKFKDTNTMFLILNVGLVGVTYTSGLIYYSALFKQFEFIDGSPCGKVVE